MVKRKSLAEDARQRRQMALAAAAVVGVGSVVWLAWPEAHEGTVEVVEDDVPVVVVAEAPEGLPDRYTVELEGAEQARRRRTTTVDLVPVVGREQQVEVVYDLDAVTRPITLARLRESPEWVVGVRLLLGEVGAWRLRTGRWSLVEGVGILETVANRLEPDLANPLRIAGVKSWPGCGQGGSFASCVDPEQYVGLDSDRALRPRTAIPDVDELHRAIDVAVAAWFVYEEALLGEITAGSTSFVHLCGGSRYGWASDVCDAPGAKPNHGPIVFRGPSAWSASKGNYALSALGLVDFAEGRAPTDSRAYIDYLLGTDPNAFGESGRRR